MADAQFTPAESPFEGLHGPNRPPCTCPCRRGIPPALVPLLDLLEEGFLAASGRDPSGAAHGVLALSRLRAVLRMTEPGFSERSNARKLGRWLGAALVRGLGGIEPAARLERRFRGSVEEWARRTRTGPTGSRGSA